jgi:hypothetical protein
MNHPAIKEIIKYTQRGIITSEILASIFNVDRFLVPGGIQTTSPETENETDDADQFNFILSKTDLLLCYAAPSPGLDQPSAGYSFSWRGLLGGQAFESVVNRGREERAHSDWFEVRMAFDLKKVAGDLGVFFKNAVQ